jgi:hypothetical protein
VNTENLDPIPNQKVLPMFEDLPAPVEDSVTVEVILIRADRYYIVAQTSEVSKARRFERKGILIERLKNNYAKLTLSEHRAIAYGLV